MKRRKKGNVQNKIAMLSITCVVAILFMGMMTKSLTLKEEIADCQAEIKTLDSKIEEETERTTEIDDIKKYMQTDEYYEEVAREKLGLVKDNEIVFKEQQ